jgi:hypothetical protein
VSLFFAAIAPPPHAQLNRYQTLPVGPSGKSRFYDRVHDAVAAFDNGEIPPPDPPADPGAVPRPPGGSA